MTESVDLENFQLGVQSELGMLEIPKKQIEMQLRSLFDGEPPLTKEFETGLFPSPKRPRQKLLSEKEWHEKLQRDLSDNYMLMLKHLIALEPDNQEWQKQLEQFRLYRVITPETFAELWEKRQKSSERKAKQLLAQEEIRSRICHSLKTMSNDAFEIAKIITPLLIGLVAAETISVPLLPILFASIALAIARMGIAGLCADKNKKSDDKNN